MRAPSSRTCEPQIWLLLGAFFVDADSISVQLIRWRPQYEYVIYVVEPVAKAASQTVQRDRTAARRYDEFTDDDNILDEIKYLLKCILANLTARFQTVTMSEWGTNAMTPFLLTHITTCVGTV